IADGVISSTASSRSAVPTQAYHLPKTLLKNAGSYAPTFLSTDGVAVSSGVPSHDAEDSLLNVGSLSCVTMAQMLMPRITNVSTMIATNGFNMSPLLGCGGR